MTVGMCVKNASLSHCDKQIFSHLNLTMPAGKWVALLGPACKGKSGFLRMVAGQPQPEEKVFFQISTDNNLPIQEQVSFMSSDTKLLPWLTVLDNLTVRLQLNDCDADYQSHQREMALSILTFVGIEDACNLYPHQLSPTLTMQVLLAKIAVENQPIVLLDDIFRNIDANTRHCLQELAADLMKNKTVLFVTSHPTDALRLADEVYVMRGLPVTLDSVLQLTSATPREIASPQLGVLESILDSQLIDEDLVN